MKVFYHGTDLDGKGSAAVINYYLLDFLGREEDFIPITHSQKFKFKQGKLTVSHLEITYPSGDIEDIPIAKGEEVYVVDFRLSPFDVMIELNKWCNLTWIDHHKSAFEDYTENKDKFNLQGVLDGESKQSACQLTYKYITKRKDAVPLPIYLIDSLDLFINREDYRTIAFYYGMESLPNYPTSPVWKKLFEDVNYVMELIGNGILIRKYIDISNENLSNYYSYEREMFIPLFNETICALVCNTNTFGSGIFDAKRKEKNYDMYITFNLNKNGKWRVSMYGGNNPNVDCSLLAKKYGGGGHKNAAGCELETDELFFLPVERV